MGNKTVPTGEDPKAFIEAITDDQVKQDCMTIVSLMTEISGEDPVMWGPSIIGFGQYTYEYASRRSGQFFMTGFSPRKKQLSLYIMPGATRFQDLLDRLGKHKTGKSCLYIRDLASVDLKVLKELMKAGYEYMKNKYH